MLCLQQRYRQRTVTAMSMSTKPQKLEAFAFLSQRNARSQYRESSQTHPLHTMLSSICNAEAFILERHLLHLYATQSFANRKHASLGETRSLRFEEYLGIRDMQRCMSSIAMGKCFARVISRIQYEAISNQSISEPGEWHPTENESLTLRCPVGYKVSLSPNT